MTNYYELSDFSDQAIEDELDLAEADNLLHPSDFRADDPILDVL